MDNEITQLVISHSIHVTRKGRKSTAYRQHFEEIKITYFLFYEGFLNVTFRIQSLFEKVRLPSTNHALDII